MKNRSTTVDMINGPLFSNIVRYCIPIMLSSLLQILYNTADTIVVGRFAGQQAMAAVGSTTYITSLITCLFLGLSSGVSVMVAQYYGAKKEKDVSETVHTAISVSLLAGTILVVIGVVFSHPILEMMNTPEDVIDFSSKYMTICFLGMPGQMLFNFAAAVLRSIGDTKRPFYFLTTSGVVNVLLNVVFVAFCGMDVDGVALATIISQYMAAVMVLVCLLREKGCCRFEWKKMAIHWDKIREICRIGIPTGLSNSCYAIGSVLIQSGINSFGSVTMAACTASSNIENIIYVCINAFAQGVMVFVGQNMGAKKIGNFHRIVRTAMVIEISIAVGLGGIAILFGKTLLGIYTDDSAVITVGMQRLTVVCSGYVVCAIQEILLNAVRGMGYSLVPSVTGILGACGIRVAWVYTVFRKYHTVVVLHLGFGASWLVTGVLILIYYFIVHHQLSKKMLAEQETFPTTEAY